MVEAAIRDENVFLFFFLEIIYSNVFVLIKFPFVNRQSIK